MSQYGRFISYTVVAEDLVGNDGVVVSPIGGHIHTVGATPLYVFGNAGTATTTVAIVGLTNHALLIGDTTGNMVSMSTVGATGQGLMGNTGADPSWTGSPTYSGTVTGTTGLSTINGPLTVGNTAVYPAVATMQFYKTNGAGATITGDLIGDLNWLGNDGTGSLRVACIESQASGTIGVGRIAANLRFYTHPDSVAANPTLRMTIAPTGEITIAAPDSGRALTITAGGQTITAGGLTVTAGGITATANDIETTNGSVYIGENAADALASNLQFRKSRPAGPTPVITTGDALGQVLFSGNDGTNFITASKITSTSSGTIATNRVASDLKFYTHPDSTTASTLRLTIAPTGEMTVAAPDSGTALTITAGGLTVTAGGLTVTAGGAGITGTTNINTTGSAVTSIGTGGTGATNIGNATGNTSVTGTLTASGTIIATSGDVRAGSTTANSTASDIAFYKSHGVATIVTSGDALGQLKFCGYDGATYEVGAQITSTSSGTIGTTRIPADLKFYTHPDSSAASPTLRMTINPAGQITMAKADTGTTLTITDGGFTVTAGTTTLTPLAAATAGFVRSSTLGALSALADSTTVGQVMMASAGAPGWSTYALPTTPVQGDLLYASSATVISQLAKDTNATRYLSNTGTNNNPAWAQVALGTGISGTLGISNGGTNSTSYTNYGVVYYSGTALVNDGNTTINPTGTLTSTTLRTGATTAYLSATGDTISAGGSLSDVDISLTPKGIGDVNITTASTGYNNGQIIFRGIPTGGWSQSEWRTGQCVVQTTDATPTPILSIVLTPPTAKGLMVSIKILINGFQSDYSDCVGGEILATAYRKSTSDNIQLVGAPIINVNYTDTVDTSDIDANINTGTQSLNLNVIGVAAQNWNWVATYTYMYTISNA